ncbi:PIN domain-containing protein [Nocardioides sp. SLBN-35]|uniref:PIN domain-containing protein n=1 Tax=Nocardioides sp. SLBN-35 TaxID=2768445 RepID=UPI001150588D|nr:PIN domain-containing protein [Nocardioides sp. SLBN-35]TQK72519.1 tRNA(fMet)-specific endonuclease VapC [Nocardioides sp. SLBN-35]
MIPRHRHLIDTDVAIELLRKRDLPLRERWRAAGPVAASAVSLFELRFGAARSTEAARNALAVDELAAAVDFLEFDADAAAHAGDIRADLARRGTPIGAYDVMIAGHARSRGLIVVTRNEREFHRVEGLRVERW